MIHLIVLILASWIIAPAIQNQPPSREQKVRDDRKKIEAEAFWIYNDLTKAIAQAHNTNKPILVVLRCIPCEECVKLDDDLVNQDPVIRPLLDKFVCVRVVSTNGLNLPLFQFDTDQSFAVFLMNAEGTIYGRFGTRSHRTNWVGDVSIAGLAKAMQGALALHADFPENKDLLDKKRGPVTEFFTPEQYPALKDKYGPELDYSGNVVKSCIHCHQIGDAQRQYYRTRNEPIPEKVLFPYPHPRSIGLILDPKEKATILEVVDRSLAAKAGFQKGDEIVKLAGQPLLSIADVQWVLHTTSPKGGKLLAEVTRNGKTEQVTLDLPEHWRRSGDLSWRSSTWGLRRMALGGMVLEPLPAAERAKLTLADDNMVLRVKHVGQFGPHAAAKQAGFQVGDIIIGYDGRIDLLRETDVLAHGVNARKAGEHVEVKLLRSQKPMTLKLPMQE